MRFIASILFFLVTSLCGCNTEFGSCLKKVQDLHVYQNNTLVIPLKSKTLVFSQTPLKGYDRYDPFLNLYLFKPLDVKYPFKWNKYLKNKELAAISDRVICGKIIQDQEGLDHFAQFSKPLKNSAVILNGCCELIAINTPKGIIQKHYLQRFLSGKNNYGDIGIRVMYKNNHVIVHTVNKLINSPFERGDLILRIDNKKIASLQLFEEKVLFAPIGKVYRVNILRDGKKKTFKVKV
ncbi:MAG: PDZ domain-containing protein, partial [Epsilonproteobacteria bacterium]|nr:PDZ domain-containing protein [Campylobacterota bacterium]